MAAGFDTPRKVLQTSPAELAKTADISMQMADDLLEQVRKNILGHQTQE